MTILAYGLMAIALLGMIGGGLYKVRESGKDAIRLEWNDANLKARAEEAARSAAAAKELLAERAKRKVVIQERTVYVDKIVDRPVYRNQCFDADGLSCLNAAIAGKDTAGCKPDRALPPARPPG